MSHAFTSLLIHVVFSTKNRMKDLTQEVRPELYQHLKEIAGNKGARLLAVGGGLDHVHLLLGLQPTDAPAGVIGALKTNTSRWLRSDRVRHFSWQNGYAAFSVSKSMQSSVRAYIEGQEEHHKRVDFESEYVSLLKKNEIEFENERLW
jgi:REP element-mobilizing transposase RayT